MYPSVYGWTDNAPRSGIRTKRAVCYYSSRRFRGRRTWKVVVRSSSLMSNWYRPCAWAHVTWKPACTHMQHSVVACARTHALTHAQFTIACNAFCGCERRVAWNRVDAILDHCYKRVSNEDNVCIHVGISLCILVTWGRYIKSLNDWSFNVWCWSCYCRLGTIVGNAC